MSFFWMQLGSYLVGTIENNNRFYKLFFYNEFETVVFRFFWFTLY